MSEAWPLMISSVKATGSLPDLREVALDWLPVDVAAEAVVQVGNIGASSSVADSGRDDKEIPVYHILNPHNTPTWSSLLHWLQTLHPNFAILPPNQWVEQLENLTGAQANHPARKLIGLWRDAYCGDESVRDEGDGKGRVVFETEKTSKTIPVMRNIQPIDEALFTKIWTWIEGEMAGEGNVTGS